MGVSSIFGRISTPHRPRWRIGPVATVAMVVSVGAVMATAPRVLVNTTPSEPPGLYVRSPLTPVPGRIVAFTAPAAAFPYADRRLSYLHRTPLLKAVAAGPGDLVCTLNGQLEIDGKARAPIAQVDRQGIALPHWSACRRLTADELFVFSDRVPNSFDSRYFGPVHRRAVLGVYAPLAVLTSGGR
jgi:conjugative transfer signal peptidase TraF